MPDGLRDQDALYEAGLRAAVTAVLDYGFVGIEGGKEWSGPAPPAAVVQVRRAAHSGVTLDTVLRRCIAGHTLLADFVMEEAECAFSGRSEALRNLRNTQASLLERLADALAAEHRREVERTEHSPEQRLARQVQRLLASERVDPTSLGDYPLDGWHIGMIATGANVETVFRGLAERLRCRALFVPHGEEAAWVWLGAQRRITDEDVRSSLPAHSSWPADMSLAVGEPGYGINGWRATHRQAQDALRVALRLSRQITLFTDVEFIAPWVREAAVAGTFIDKYLSPLDGRGCSGETLRETLRAYFRARRNASAAASALGVSTRAMSNRLAMIQEALGPLFDERQAELELALRLDAHGLWTASTARRQP